MKINLKNPFHFLALGFGSGLSPKAPGTAGTMVAIPLYLLLSYCSPGTYFLLVTLMTVAGIFICDVVAKKVGIEDDPRIVWDEIVGYFLTMFLAPPGWMWVLLGFILFRCLDIVKPWPISVCDQKIKGGLGIMLDDVLAGLGAFCILQSLKMLLH